LGLVELQKKASKKKYIISYLPKNLKDLINGEKKISFQNKNLKSAYLIDIIHGLINKHFQTGEISFNLSSKILREKYGQNYSFYMNYLVKNKILNMVSNYCVGKKSKSYRLPDETITDISSYKNDDTILLKKYKKIYTYSYLKNMNYKHIDFEIMVKIVQYIDNVHLEYTDAHEYLKKLKLNKKQKEKNFHSIECLKHNDIWYNFDRYGRFHSNFTTLKSEIRNKFLLIDGEPTMELDITNSQPIFLSFLMSKHLDKIDHEEYEFFKQLVITGSLYQYFSEHTNISDKKQIKKIIYRVLFGTNHLNNKENKMFNSIFPSIFSFIRWYKKEKDNYKSLAYELQNSESNLLFNTICREIIDKYPDLPFFTVHDSITVKYRDYNKIKEIFNKHINFLHKKL
jgi:hypothetical protein